MKTASESDPIFVHASPRSGSTYFFNVLRRNHSLMCFNESIIDVFSYYTKEDIAGLKVAQEWNVNHHFLQRDDFDEIVAAWDAVIHLYPPFPSFQNYLPSGSEFPSALRAYLAGLVQFARDHGKRPVFCEIYSRGRAGALRSAFGGFHIAQYRDPLSQFGSFFRTLLEGGEWGFLTFPLMELGISGGHPLYRLVPEHWRPPVLPWPEHNRAQRWSSAVQYISMVAAPDSETPEKAMRWHLFSWFLSNLAAVSYADLVLDIDRAHDDSCYGQTFIDRLESKCEVVVNFRDITKFLRYYEFDSFDVAQVCGQVKSAMKGAILDGRLDKAVRALGAQPPIVDVAAAAETLFSKLDSSLAMMAASTDRSRISEKDWKAVTAKHRTIWFYPSVRILAQRLYPFAAPLARAARRARIRHRARRQIANH
jgi:hypothetical protein